MRGLVSSLSSFHVDCFKRLILPNASLEGLSKHLSPMREAKAMCLLRKRGFLFVLFCWLISLPIYLCKFPE